MASVPICVAYLFRSTIGEIVKLINISNEEWLALLEKIFYFTRRREYPIFLRHFLYIMRTMSLYGLSVIFPWCVSLGTNLLVQNDHFQWKIVHKCEGDNFPCFDFIYARIHYPNPGGHGVMCPQTGVPTGRK